MNNCCWAILLLFFSFFIQLNIFSSLLDLLCIAHQQHMTECCSNLLKIYKKNLIQLSMNKIRKVNIKMDGASKQEVNGERWIIIMFIFVILLPLPLIKFFWYLNNLWDQFFCVVSRRELFVSDVMDFIDDFFYCAFWSRI